MNPLEIAEQNILQERAKDDFVKDCKMLTKLLCDTATAYELVKSSSETEKIKEWQERITANADLIAPLWGKVMLTAYEAKIPMPKLSDHKKESIFEFKRKVNQLLDTFQ